MGIALAVARSDALGCCSRTSSSAPLEGDVDIPALYSEPFYFAPAQALKRADCNFHLIQLVDVVLRDIAARKNRSGLVVTR